MSEAKDSSVPLQFAYTDRDFVTDVCRSSGNSTGKPSLLAQFDTLLQTGWTDRMERGLFRYNLGDLQTRVIPGSHNFVAQLNIQRGTEKRKPQEILSIKQEFNPRQFNFNKINPEEILFEMIKDTHGGTALQNGGQLLQPSRMTVLVNVSPLEFGHCLFVPDPSRCLPQVLTRFTIQVGIESVLLSSGTGFRVGFNSLGGFASVNHLHLHGYYMDHELYEESEEVEDVARAICEVTDFLVDGNIAHNLFLTRGCPPCDHIESENNVCVRKGVRIAVWPRLSCFGAKEDSAFNVALCELAGHLPFKNNRDYELSTEKDVTDIIQKYLLPEDGMQALEQQLTRLLLGF